MSNYINNNNIYKTINNEMSLQGGFNSFEIFRWNFRVTYFGNTLTAVH